MDYFIKNIVFRKPGLPKLEFVGDHKILPTCLISVLEANRLLHKGCEAYPKHIVDTSTLEVTLKSVPIVREFLDVFFKDLPRLPPDRELEFGIDLLPGSVPNSIPPYKMVLVELKELKA